MRGDLHAAPDAVRLCATHTATITVNLFRAFALNVAAIPMAAAGLLNPLIGIQRSFHENALVISQRHGPDRPIDAPLAGDLGDSESHRDHHRPIDDDSFDEK